MRELTVSRSFSSTSPAARIAASSAAIISALRPASWSSRALSATRLATLWRRRARLAAASERRDSLRRTSLSYVTKRRQKTKDAPFRIASSGIVGVLADANPRTASCGNLLMIYHPPPVRSTGMTTTASPHPCVSTSASAYLMLNAKSGKPRFGAVVLVGCESRCLSCRLQLREFQRAQSFFELGRISAGRIVNSTRRNSFLRS